MSGKTVHLTMLALKQAGRLPVGADEKQLFRPACNPRLRGIKSNRHDRVTCEECRKIIAEVEKGPTQEGEGHG